MAKNTHTLVTDFHTDKIVKKLGKDFKEMIKGTTHIENWKLAVGIGSGIIYPTIPFLVGLLYVLYRMLNSNKYELEEGVHYETKEMKEVEEEE